MTRLASTKFRISNWIFAAGAALLLAGCGGPTAPTIHVTPSTSLRDGEQVLVQVRGADSGGKFFVSECASAADANVNGCGDQLAAQPFGVTDSSGAGSITFRVRARAATKPYNTAAFQTCTDQCVLMATGGFGGKFVYAPLKFSGHEISKVTTTPVHASLLGTPDHVAGVLPSGSGWVLTTVGLEFTPDGGNSFSLVPYPIPVMNIGDIAIKGPHVIVAGVINFLPVMKSSDDFGATWKSVTLPTGSGSAGFVRFVTRNGIVIGMLATDVSSSNFSVAEWYATSDGGVTWKHNSIPSGGVVTAAGGDLWLAGGPQLASLYRSADLGVTWSKVSIPAAIVNNGAALSVPGQLKNGNVVLMATSPNMGPASWFGVTIYVSGDQGVSWKVLAHTSLVGHMSSGVVVAAAVVADTIWLGTTTDKSIVVISANGTLTKTSSIGGLYPGGWITSIGGVGNSSAWITAAKGECPSGKLSCRQVSALMRTIDGGKTWTSINLDRRPTS